MGDANHEKELVQAVTDDAEKKKAIEITAGDRQWQQAAAQSSAALRHRPPATEREHHQKHRYRYDPKSGEREWTEEMRRVLHDDEIDAPDHGHREEESVRQAEGRMRRRLGEDWCRSD